MNEEKSERIKQIKKEALEKISALKEEEQSIFGQYKTDNLNKDQNDDGKF